MHTCVCMCIHMCVYMYIYRDVHIIHICMYVYIYIYIYINNDNKHNNKRALGGRARHVRAPLSVLGACETTRCMPKQTETRGVEARLKAISYKRSVV